MSTKRNIIANVGGRLWQSLMSFAFVPFYIHFMGVEAYGLVGFFTSMLAVFTLLDLGLSVTVNRELARLSGEEEGRRDSRTLVRTLESVYWAVGIVMAAALILAAPWIAQHWLKVQTLPLKETTRAVRLMGCIAALRWPVSLYAGALMGMRRHVRYNVITSFYTTLQGGGAVLALWLLAPRVEVFFSWQLLAAAIQIVLLYVGTWRVLALPGHLARFARQSLTTILHFSAGVTGITILSVILTQLDKFLLSKLLPLEQFGYYTLASALALTLTTTSSAIYGAIFPTMTALAASGKESVVAAFYHKSCQLVSVVVIPAGAALCFFSHDLLILYLHNDKIAEQTATLLSVFAVGNVFLSIMMIPYALQLAYGWTKLSLYKNILAAALFVPMMVFLVGRFGALGAACTWLALTIGYFLFEVTIMHRRLLPGEQWRWYVQDVGVPALVSVVLVGGMRLMMGNAPSLVLALAACVLSAGAALIGSVLLLPNIRTWLSDVLHSSLKRVPANEAS